MACASLIVTRKDAYTAPFISQYRIHCFEIDGTSSNFRVKEYQHMAGSGAEKTISPGMYRNTPIQETVTSHLTLEPENPALNQDGVHGY